MTAFLALFHGMFKSIYPYIAIALLGLLSYGLWQKHKVDVASLSQITQVAQEALAATQALTEQEARNTEALRKIGELHNKLAKDTERAIHDIHQLQDPSGCIDKPHPDGINKLLNSVPGEGS